MQVRGSSELLNLLGKVSFSNPLEWLGGVSHQIAATENLIFWQLLKEPNEIRFIEQKKL